MEILSRHLRIICSQQQVSYHPKCSKLRLTHLIFADDLMIFIRGDLPSVLADKYALDHFALRSVLRANLEKTEIYFGGVSSSVKQLILNQTNFVEGSFPFRYLGAPLNTARTTADMYAGLMSKIMHSIQHWSVNLLTYAGKVQLLNSVIFGLHYYWSSSVLMPKIVINQINKLCKTFFWSSDNKNRFVFKSWSSSCFPWSEGGFDIREVLAWNKALLANLLWRLDQKSREIWSTWVHSYYFSNNNIWDITPSSTHSDSFKSILKIWDQSITTLGNVQNAQQWLRNCASSARFSVSRAYDLFRLKGPHLPWSRVLKSMDVIPSHGIISMLTGQRKLPTVDALCSRSICLVNRCVLCKSCSESHRHLFFNCSFSKAIWHDLLRWMCVSRKSSDLILELYWTQRRGHKKHWKTNWFWGSLSAAVYFIWHERNLRIFEGRERSIAQIIQSIKYVVAIRCLALANPSNVDIVVESLNR
ncbi:hypothetical protein RND81_10G084200 [Saponaria officinalis]|uniref:Reverse transcriptase zinc-binding domain-containing protein n=1 Tax=Saponaria officinalis TaxID=3572 RepID=A0AAW1I1W7_SAPOF